MAMIDVQDVVSNSTLTFATYLCAYKECTPEVQAIVYEMSAIVADKESTADERELATEVIISSLFPGAGADFLRDHEALIQALEARESKGGDEVDFSWRLQAIMAKKGMRQAELAQQMGVSQPAVSNMLNRTCRPQRRTIARLAEVLGVSPSDLWPSWDG